MKQLGERLKSLRLATQPRLSQKEFGKLFDLSESTIGMYERNERKPDYEIIRKFSDFFGVSIDYLVTGIEKQTEMPPGLSEDEREMLEFFRDPENEVFYKELKNSPEARRQAMLETWELIKKHGLDKD